MRNKTAKTTKTTKTTARQNVCECGAIISPHAFMCAPCRYAEADAIAEELAIAEAEAEAECLDHIRRYW